jgi:hypothetical protein
VPIGPSYLGPASQADSLADTLGRTHVYP